MTEDQIERRAESRFDALDRKFMSGQISEAEYDRECLRIGQWAEDQYRAADRKTWDN